MGQLNIRLTFFIITLLFSKTLLGSLYEEQCDKSSSLSRVRAVCSDGFASITYAGAQLSGWEDGDIERFNLDRDKFEAGLKSEKLRLLSDNYSELLRYFWADESIKIKEFECKDKGITNEGLFTDLGYSRKYKLRSQEEQRATFERRRTLAEELIVYQRALTEIEAEESKITRNATSYDYADNVDPKSGVPSRMLTFEARENLERLKLARFAILNSYPILDTDAWKEKSKRDIFSKPSDEEPTVDDINFVISHVFDKSISEVQDNIIEEAEATCKQSTSDLVGNDFIAAPVIAESGLYTEIYCREYDKVKGKNILKNTGLVALSVVAIAAAPLTGSSSAVVAYSALAAGGVSTGTDIYLAYRDIDNYYDLKRAFLADISTDGENSLASYEEVRSAQTQAILSTIFTGAGAAGEGIGIFRLWKARRIVVPQSTIKHIWDGEINWGLKKIEGGLHSESGLATFIEKTGYKPLLDETLENGVRRVTFGREVFNKDAWRKTVGASKRGGGVPGGKAIFPKSWSMEKIIKAAKSIKRDQNIVETASETIVHYVGVYDGVRVHAIYENGRLVTAYPSWIQP